jgi:hypothetical protein
VVAFARRILHSNVLFLTDSLNLVQVAKRWMSRSLVLQFEWRRLQDALKGVHATGYFDHLRGELNLLSDAWSRMSTRHEWSISWDLFRAVCATFHFRPTLDLFATPGNAVAPRFCSLVGAGHEGDAFRHNWHGEQLYICPPLPMIADVVQRLYYTRDSAAVVVVPEWRSSLWWPTLSAMATDVFHLGLGTHVVLPNLPHLGPISPHRNPAWTFVAFYVPARNGGIHIGPCNNSAKWLAQLPPSALKTTPGNITDLSSSVTSAIARLSGSPLSL